ncbi:hypothetical protein BESB_011020 [Besnoitia besnoiti]|uniref:Transmembrane protein n=1 Tax=Besnoitia besnoiti TaxID=94643 RepID=A0A2A9MR19_BESBE|nr:hypothetical protein BESB_011020 [Besnoitia besnoiti]PFH38760.1 hypothetical protein BESB_011020 [Besnoitia besnoiti]
MPPSYPDPVAPSPKEGANVTPVAVSPPPTLEEKVIVIPPGAHRAFPPIRADQTLTGLDGPTIVMAPKEARPQQPTPGTERPVDLHPPADAACPDSRATEENISMSEHELRLLREHLEKRAAATNCLIFLMSLWLVLTGVLLIFAFSPVNGDLAIVCMLLSVTVGIIGILAVSARNLTGMRLYLALGTVLLVLTVALWGYYIYILVRAAWATVDVTADRTSEWIWDEAEHFPPIRLGQSNVTSLQELARQGGVPLNETLDDIVGPCTKGYRDYGKDYFRGTMSVLIGLSTRGQLCNYSHYDILDFKRWPVSCWRTCGFDRLAVDHALDMSRQEDQRVISEFKSHLDGLLPVEASACILYSARTACVVENTSYHYVILGIVGLLILWTCCACLCCIPASLGVANKYLSDLRNYEKEKADLDQRKQVGGNQNQPTVV